MRRARVRNDDALARISPDDFERLMADYYRGQGYRVEHCGTGASNLRQFDGGIDLKLWKDGQYLLVQCKHWKAMQVAHNYVHELLGVMLTQKADGVIVVTSGEFSDAAIRAAGKCEQVTLVDGVALREMLGPLLPKESNLVVPDVGSWRRVLDAGADVAIDAFDRRYGRQDRSRRGSSVGKAFFWIIVAKVVIPLVFIAGFAWFMLGTMKEMSHVALTKPRVTRATPAQVPTTPGSSPTQSVSRMYYPSGGVRLVAVPAKPGKPVPYGEIGSADQMMTPQQLDEWRRRNEEAMRVLEETTPEVKRLDTKPATPPADQ